MPRLKIFLFIIFFFAFIATLIIGLELNRTSGLEKIKIKEITIEVELADTPEKRSRGLSARTTLPENQGMLFVFEKPGIYPFWMRDMKFPIDIIWIDENLKIIGITKNASPDSFPQTFKPPKPAQYILEVNADFSDHNNIVIGDTINFLILKKEVL